MTETLDLPPIADVLPPQTEAPALPTDLKRIDLQAVALAQFGDWRTDVAAARKNLGTLALDLSIPARIAEAKSLRERVINAPRAQVRKVSKALKSKLATVSKTIGAEEDAAVLAYDEAETLITPQIEAAEQRIEDERLKKAQEEADRLQALRDTVDAKLAPWVARCDEAGMTAARVQAGVILLDGLAMPPELADVSAYWGQQVAATRDTMERRRLALAQAEVEAAQAKVRAETQRVAGIQARIAEIQAAATGHERASAADLAEARIVVAALDVSEAQYQEFALLAQAAKAGTLAVLDKLHAEAVKREEIEAAQRASTPAANVATAAATEGMAENPEPGTLEAAPITQDAQESGLCAGTPAVYASSAADSATAAPSGDEGTGAHADVSAPSPDVLPRHPMFRGGRMAPITYTEPAPQPGVAPQNHQLPEADAAPGMGTAEPATADATDRDAPFDTSPRGGAMGAGQPAAAGPADAVISNPPWQGDDGSLETSEADARLYVAPLAAVPAPATDPRDEFVALVMGAFNCKFPSHPKPGPEWWAKVRAAGQALQAQA